MPNVGLLIEFQDGRIKETSLGLAAAAEGQGRKLFAFAVDGPGEDAKSVLEEHGVGHIVNITTGNANANWNPAVWTDAVVAAMENYGIDTLIGLTSPGGREMLPRIAARLNAPLVMDCIHIDLDDHTARTSQ